MHYLDDVLIHTRGLEEHLDLVEQVLRAHLESGILLKPSKMLFFQEKVDFLGFKVSGSGIRPTDHHIQTIKNLQAPKTRKQFIPEFFRLTAQMNRLRNKRELTEEDWTPEIDTNILSLIKLFLKPGGPV